MTAVTFSSRKRSPSSLCLPGAKAPLGLPGAKAHLRLLAALVGLSLLAGCAGLDLGGGAKPATPGPVVQAPPAVIQPVQPTPMPGRDTSKFYTPKYMAGLEPVRVALLLPFSSPRADVRNVANALYNAAQLSLFDFNNPNVLLIPKATNGSAASAAAAATTAINEGADIILGPLFAEEVSGIAVPAGQAHIPVIAFSTDTSVGGGGVYLLSFAPFVDVNRIVDYATRQGLTSYGALYPAGSYGNRVSSLFREAVAQHGGTIVASASYPATSEGMYEPAKQVAGSMASYKAIFLPEGGAALKQIAPMLSYFDVDTKAIKLIGTGQWDDPTLAHEPSLDGAWYPAPPPEGHLQFAQRYRTAYGATPPRIASLAYDAVSLTIALSARPGDDRFSSATLTAPDGFSGVDGIFRFLPNGWTERGLAIMENRPGGAVVIDPAPVAFQSAPVF
ncbi:MAG: penicillin-binding protein activator [Parvibaculum sp.]